MAKFKVGDVVKLKSGGPTMTVSIPEDSYGKVWCQWFAGSKLESGNFPVDSVIVISEGASGKK